MRFPAGPLPSFMGLTIVAGVLFGAAWGTGSYVSIGGALSTAVGYYFAKWIGRSAVQKMVAKNDALSEWERELMITPGVPYCRCGCSICRGIS